MIFVYRAADGEILQTVNDPVPGGDAAHAERLRALGHHVCVVPRYSGINRVPLDELFVKEDGEIGQRMDMPLVVPAPASIPADEASELVITGLPANTIVMVDGEYAGTADDGILELTTGQIGTHTVSLRARGFFPATVEFEGVAP